jgi:hypothetical protein
MLNGTTQGRPSRNRANPGLNDFNPFRIEGQMATGVGRIINDKMIGRGGGTPPEPAAGDGRDTTTGIGRRWAE